jgi:hypothetical protein
MLEIRSGNVWENLRHREVCTTVERTSRHWTVYSLKTFVARAMREYRGPTASVSGQYMVFYFYHSEIYQVVEETCFLNSFRRSRAPS